MTKIVDIEDIRKKREKKEIGIPIENINKKELKRRGHEIGDILGCDEKGEEICVRKRKREPLCRRGTWKKNNCLIL